MKEYTTEMFYRNEYLAGAETVLPSAEQKYWFRKATDEIRYYSFGRIDRLGEIPEKVQICCCEVAEKLYKNNLAKDQAGRVLQSYSNDGDSGTFLSSDLSEKAVEKAVRDIIHRHLSNTGLLYCGG